MARDMLRRFKKLVKVRNAMQPKQILIVEDNDILCKTLQRYLVGQDLRVTTTRTVAGARDLLGAHSFDALLVDFYLPDACGLDLIPLLPSPGIPVVAMTAEDPVPHNEQARNSGVAAFLGKPFSLAVLKRILKCVLTGHRCLPYCTQLPRFKIAPSCTQS